MATQLGTGGLTAAGQAATAGTYVSVPSGSIVETVTVNKGGSPQFEDIFDEDGAHHTRITFEAGMTTASVVIVGKPFGSAAGLIDVAGYYVESVAEESSKGPVRTTVSVTLLPTA